MSLRLVLSLETRKVVLVTRKINSFSIRRNLSTKVFGWGSNDGGELGINHALDDQLTPVCLNISNVDSVSCGYGTTFLFKKSELTAYIFGLNSLGQLGTINQPEGKKIRFKGNLVAISSGRAHSLALTTDGVYAAGSNIQGQCGLKKSVKNICSFRKVLLPFDSSQVRQICCGLDSSTLLTKDGKMYSSGLGADGQTDKGHVFGWGNNEQGQISKVNQEKQIAMPTQMLNSNLIPNICQVLSGGSFSAILSDGVVYVKGYGAIGLGPENIVAEEFSRVNIDKSFGRIHRIFGSADYIAALTGSGKLLTWGRGNHGRLGHGSNDDQFFPIEVKLPGRVMLVSCGNDHLVAIVAEKDECAS